MENKATLEMTVLAEDGVTLLQQNEIDAVLDWLEQQGRANAPDTSGLDFSKSKARTAVTGAVTLLTKSRTTLTKAIDAYTGEKKAEKKRLTDAIDKQIKAGVDLKLHIETRLKAVEAEIRKPLTEWEAEQDRIARAEQAERLENQRIAEEAQRQVIADMQKQLDDAKRDKELAEARADGALKAAATVATAVHAEPKDGKRSQAAIDEIIAAGVEVLMNPSDLEEGFSERDARFIMKLITSGRIPKVGII